MSTLTKIACPGCGSTLSFDPVQLPKETKCNFLVLKCAYCGGHFLLDGHNTPYALPVFNNAVLDNKGSLQVRVGTFKVTCWCGKCGNHPNCNLTIKKEQLGFSYSLTPCSYCKSTMLSPHVEPDSCSIGSLEGYFNLGLEHLVAAVAWSLKQ